MGSMGSMAPPGPRGDPTGGLNGQDSFGLGKYSGQSSLGQLSRQSSLEKASGQGGKLSRQSSLEKMSGQGGKLSRQSSLEKAGGQGGNNGLGAGALSGINEERQD